MNLRITYSIVFALLIIALIICAGIARRSARSTGGAVAWLCSALIPPLVGNLIIIGTSQASVAVIGYYIYFLGMDVVMLSLVNFTDVYCRGIGDGQHKPTIMYIGLGIDAVQMLLNPFFGHAFSVEPLEFQEKVYFRLVPYFGQTIHRVVDYGVLVAVMLIFLIASLRTTKIYRERYTVLLGTMVTVGLWETFYIFSRTPIDRSMIGFGFYGIVVFYFSICYRPLRLLDRMLSSIASDMPEALYVFDPSNRCIWANKPGLDLAGVSGREVEQAQAALRELFGVPDSCDGQWSDTRILTGGGETRYYSLEKRSVTDESNHLAGSFLTVRDVTDENRRMQQEMYTSTHDSLTDLFTRQYLYTCIRNRLDADHQTRYLVVFVDVKNFKIVNDVFSTAFGDLALQQIAEWIRRSMNGMCVYGRLGGDTFGAFMPETDFDADRVSAELSDFVVTDGRLEHHLLIHLGVYAVVDPDTDVSVMFDRAHLALTGIKDDFNTHIAWYDSKLREKVLWDQKISGMLHEAIGQMQIRPYLQPITDRTGKVVGAEALARWIHPEHGFMSPAMFIPVFEKNGMIVELDRHMWRCACAILADWKGVHDDLFISVNISPKDFFFLDVVEQIHSLVKEYGIEPSKLRIEITETVMMNRADDSMKTLERFRSLGFIVEMDDFGSGYSSLNLLKDMPVDVLKVDMKFLSDTREAKKSDIILQSIMHLASELEIASLTEGVETEQQYQVLRGMGCRLFQGYYFAKPMPREEFEAFAFAGSC